MKFYVVSLSIYSVLSTLLVIALSIQNHQLKNPSETDAIDWDTRHEVSEANAPVWGPKDAPVTIVTFGDFECGYCAEGATHLEQLKNRYPDKIRVVFKNLPIEFHPNAVPAAKAGMAAHVQGRFFEMQTILFQNHDQLSPELYRRTAADLGLDLVRFEEDLAAEHWERLFAEDRAEAERLEIQATPTYFVNGIKITGSSEDHLNQAVELVLQETSAGS